jgi:hypothetical protein
MAKGWMLVVVCNLSFVILSAAQHTATLQGFSNSALIKCFANHQCGQDYWAVSNELARRRPTRLLIVSYRTSTNSLEKSGILLALYQINSTEVARFMRTAIDSKTLVDEDLYYANDYLAQRCDDRALRFLSGSGTNRYFQLAACPEWSRTVSYFGRCHFRPAATFLVNSLESQCLDIGNAAANSLAALFPDAPKKFANRKALTEYFSKRAADEAPGAR